MSDQMNIEEAKTFLLNRHNLCVKIDCTECRALRVVLGELTRLRGQVEVLSVAVEYWFECSCSACKECENTLLGALPQQRKLIAREMMK